SLPRLSTPPTTPSFPYTTLFRSRNRSLCCQFKFHWLDRAVFDRHFDVQHERLDVQNALVLLMFVFEDIVVFHDDEVLLGVKAYRSEEHTSELQSRENLVCRLLLE